MQAQLTRDGQPVGVFVMTRSGVVSQDFEPAERERLEPIIAEIIKQLGEPPYVAAWYGDDPEYSMELRLKPGDQRWFEKVLRKLKAKGYDSLVIQDPPGTFD